MTKETKRNGRHRGNGWAAEVLARIYGNERVTVFTPLAIGALVYVLFLTLCTHPAKAAFAWTTLGVAVVMYVATLLVLGFQLRNPGSTPKYMDYWMLFLTVGYVLGAVTLVPGFLFDLKEGMQTTAVGYITAISAIARVYSRRI